MQYMTIFGWEKLLVPDLVVNSTYDTTNGFEGCIPVDWMFHIQIFMRKEGIADIPVTKAIFTAENFLERNQIKCLVNS